MLSDKSFLELVTFPLLNERVNFLEISAIGDFMFGDFKYFWIISASCFNSRIFQMSIDLYLVRILSNNLQTVNLGTVFEKVNSALL